ncbi:MAG TPA: maleylpyruvate isomerase N-terminal domain-containing protein [Anaerolineales bacterium]|nr:maleylpyruvate isomerase N-terminal domain-containing protein [Anaerolineales bacterium]
MVLDHSFVEQNRVSTERIRKLVSRLSDQELQCPVGEHWTVGVALAHLAFWDRRVLYALDKTEQDGKLFTPEVDVLVNDLSLPLWAAIPPRGAAHLAVETAQILDQRLANFSPELLEELYNYNKRWVIRALHRGEHLDDVEQALKSRS